MLELIYLPSVLESTADEVFAFPGR